MKALALVALSSAVAFADDVKPNPSVTVDAPVHETPVRAPTDENTDRSGYEANLDPRESRRGFFLHAGLGPSVTIGGGTPVYGAPVYGGPVYQPAPRVVLPVPPLPPLPVIGVPVPPRHAYPARWDVDGDGIPNRYDRYDNRYRHGGYDGRRWDHDRDGVPNGRDRYDHNPRRW